MGGNAASRSIIDIETATQRLGYAEVSKIEEGFARLAVGGQLRRSEFRTGFLNSIAGAPVPEAFASALFDGFDTTASGTIAVQEFVCALAIIRKGTPEERLRLLFAVYDADRDKRLSDRDLERFAQALSDGRAGATREKAVDDALEALTAQGPIVGFERFSRWAQSNMDSPLIDWVFDIEQRLESELRGATSVGAALPPTSSSAMAAAAEDDECVANDRMLPLERTISAEGREDERELAELSRELGLQTQLARDLRTVWRSVVGASQFGVIDSETFRRELQSLPPRLSRRLFRAMDHSGTGTLSLQEWSQGLALCLLGSADAEARARFCCRLFSPEATAEVSAATEAAAPSVVGGSISPLTMSAAGANELRLLADSWSTSFVVIQEVDEDYDCSGVDGAKLEAQPQPCFMGGEGLTLEQLSTQPWALRVEIVMRCIGYLVRIDLSLHPRDPREERRIVDWLNAKFDPEMPGDVGDIWFLLPARWWQLWCECTGPGARAGRTNALSIDSSSLVDDHASLRIGLNHRVDYELVTGGAWRALQAWHGGPGPELPRIVIEIDRRRELEMYPLRVHVNRTDDAGEVLLLDKALEVSRAKLLGELKVLACALHGITDPVVLYHRSSPNVDWESGDDSLTLHSLGFIDGHRLLLQKASKRSTALVSPSGGHSPRGRGVLAAVGLQNLGNTCYMNASLQCLVHTPLLPRYFNVEYRFDVNMDGGWGMAGKLAIAFAELLADVESAKANGTGVIAPRAFRRTIGDFHPQFAGWKQQDAQEFLSVFMAGLSEDVNRTHHKPYVELKDSEGRPDAVVAREFWSAHCRRERSAIAALFSGQFRSVLRCKVCGHENAAFDPFSFLPIPLPEHDFRWVTCSVVSTPRAGALDQHTMQVCTRVPKLGHVSDLLQAVAGLTGLTASDLIATEVAEGYVFRRLEQGDPLSQLGDDSRPMVFHAMPPPLLVQLAHQEEAVQGAWLERFQPAIAPTAALASEPSWSPGEHSATYMEVEKASCGLADSPRSSAADESGEMILYLVNRRLRKVQRYFLNPYTSEVFASPALLRAPAPSIGAGSLYSQAFRLVWHLVPDYVPSSSRPWPFTLSTVKRDGSACSQCSWRRGCLGCKVSSEHISRQIALRDGDTLGIDWDAEVLEKQYKMKLAAHVHVHESVELAQIERNAPERLPQCLSALVKEEELTAYCRECTKYADGEYTESSHTKALKIWACGPLVVLQLKRFHSNDGTSYKLHNLVTFPTVLDMSDYLVQDADQQDTAAEEPATKTMRGGDAPDQFVATSPRPTRPEPAAASGASAGGKDALDEATFQTLSREVVRYQLYGVVNHIGGMGSGHYTAFVRGGPILQLPPLSGGGDGLGLGAAPNALLQTTRHKWLCCDDDRAYEISEEDVVTANAYLLFYAREDVAAGEVGLHDIFPMRAAEAVACDIDKVKTTPWVRQQKTAGAGGGGVAAASGPGRSGLSGSIGSSGLCGVM